MSDPHVGKAAESDVCTLCVTQSRWSRVSRAILSLLFCLGSQENVRTVEAAINQSSSPNPFTTLVRTKHRSRQVMPARTAPVVLTASSAGPRFGTSVMAYMCKLAAKDRNECGEGWGYLSSVEEGGGKSQIRLVKMPPACPCPLACPA